MNSNGAYIIPPRMGVGSYKTYKIASPISTHYRKATCQEIDCVAYKEGWTYRKADLVREQLYDIVTHAGKRYREQYLDESESDLYLVFEPGQVCFQAASHVKSLDRPEIYYAGRGHFTAFSTRKAAVLETDEWLESFVTHQDALHAAFELRD